MKGEVILVVDGGTQDSATYDTLEKKTAAIQQFLEVRQMILREHPYSDVRVDVREKTE